MITIPIPTITNQLEAIIYFIQKLDLEMVEMILKDDLTYQDLEKKKFIQILRDGFFEFNEAGDEYLNVYKTSCNSCNKGKLAYLFVGNKSKNYMCFYFDTKNGEIDDMYECNWFKFNKDFVELNKKVYLDSPPFPF